MSEVPAVEGKRSYKWGANRAKWCHVLRDYVVSLDEPQQEIFAEKCGTSLDNVRQMMYGNRGIKERFAIAFDRETNGVVSMFVTRPDVDWHHVANAILLIEMRKRQS